MQRNVDHVYEHPRNTMIMYGRRRGLPRNRYACGEEFAAVDGRMLPYEEARRLYADAVYPPDAGVYR